MIKLDFTTHSVVVACDKCPWWSAFAFDREEGWRTARRHELAFHEGDQQALRALAAFLWKASRFQENTSVSIVDECPPQTSSPGPQPA
ncbi:hypothetical protein C5D09_06350 [Rathayibacter sp. AY1C9]|uniref:hypothetical protein n=1 Tax=Rathayibacter sp. AY1C9 TaxID=2080541 RepID=UPI000CE937F3|nr:hypothetical protein [Rathayibacter sp. AY1C9]PPH46996.1 hypothetical protein C5D09_06350 [Rathayibacter sp. AY1C9]